MTRHKDLVGVDIHVIHAFTFANAGARTGATGLVAADVGKVAKQSDDDSYWILTAVAPTWLQIADSDLADIAALTPADGNFIVGNGTNWITESGATARTSLGLTIGTDVQAFDTGLADIAALAVTDGNFIVGNGANWVAESGATVRTSLGLGTGDTPQFTGVQFGADITLSRGAADRLDLATGDDLNVVFGNIQIAGATVINTGGSITATGGITYVTQLFRSTLAGITAFAGGGQGSAVLLDEDLSEISTVVSPGDSVKLAFAATGLKKIVINNGANAMDVFPNTGDDLGSGVNVAQSLAAGSNVTYVAFDATNWEKVVNGNGIGDFSDGGDVAGADRTLGNTDAFKLELITNNIKRITMLGTGPIGLHAPTPDAASSVEITNRTTTSHGLVLQEIAAGAASGTDMLRWIDQAGNLRGKIDFASDLSLGPGTTPGIDDFIRFLFSSGKIEVFNKNGTASLQLDARGGAQDSFVLYTDGGGNDWVHGRDDDDGFNFKISQAAVLGTNDYFEIDFTTGNVSISKDLVVTERFSTKLVTKTLSGTQNDFDPGETAYLRGDALASTTLTGLANGTDGRHLIITSINSVFNIVISNENASSAAANRIITGTGGTITLAQDESAILIYDSVTSRWRVVARQP